MRGILLVGSSVRWSVVSFVYCGVKFVSFTILNSADVFKYLNYLIGCILSRTAIGKRRHRCYLTNQNASLSKSACRKAGKSIHSSN